MSIIIFGTVSRVSMIEKWKRDLLVKIREMRTEAEKRAEKDKNGTLSPDEVNFFDKMEYYLDEMEKQKLEYERKYGENKETNEMGFYEGDTTRRTVYRFGFKKDDKNYWIAVKLDGHKFACSAKVHDGCDYLGNYEDIHVIMYCAAYDVEGQTRFTDATWPTWPSFN